MKKTLLTLLLLTPLFLFAQPKHDYVWLLGYHPEPGFPDPILGGSILDFNQYPPDTSFFNIPLRFKAIAMVSDSSGQLLFYTNACQIINRNHQLMSNGDSINPGFYHDNYCWNGYPLYQGVLILPYPGDLKKYILLHILKQDTGILRELLYSVIDMDTPDALGQVVSKNQMLLTGNLADMMTGTRHGNGRDWWVVLPKDESNEYYLFRITPEGVLGPETRQFGPAWNYKDWSGQSVFSPDGRKYARTNPFNGLHIANFDRCSGQFSSPIKITFPNDTISSSGAAFSPNSRYLYVSASKKVYQFDTEADDIAATQQTVAVYDGYQSPFSTRFFQQMLAPDGKIYITTPSSNNVLHVIHNPDEAGAACNFEQHGLILPTLHAFMAPNFPHFRLYDMSGSPCDTLGIDGPVVSAPEQQEKAGVMTLQPNPADGSVTINFSENETGVLLLSDITGKIWQQQHKSYEMVRITLNTRHFPAGLYIATFYSESGKTASRKLLVQH